MANGGYEPNTHTMRGDIQPIHWIYPRSDANVDPEYYGNNLFIRWSGAANGINVTGVATATEYIDSVANQITIRWANASDGTGCEVQVVGSVSNLLICREEDVADYDNGYVTTPEARQLWSNATDTRYMQIQGIHPTHITRAEQLAHFEDPFWCVVSEINHETTAGTRSGFPLQACYKMSEELDTDPWVCMPAFLGAPAIDEPLGGVSAWNTLGTSSAIDFIANTSEIANWCGLSLAAMDLAGTPVTRRVSKTIGNEIWNWSNPYGDQTHFYSSIGSAIPGNSHSIKWKVAYGYQSAKLAHQLQIAKDATIGTANDRSAQPITVMLEYQNASSNQVDAMEEGITLYESAAGITIDRSVFEVSASCYVKGIFGWNIHNALLGQTYTSSENYFTAFWAHYEARTEYINNNFDVIYDEWLEYLMNSGVQNTVQGILRWNQEGYEKAIGYGMGIGCNYEGGSHEDTVNASSVSDLDNNPKRLAFYRGWLDSAQHAAIWTEFNRQGHIRFGSLSSRYGVADFYRISAAQLGVTGGDNQPWFERDKYSDPPTLVELVNNGVAQRRKNAEAMV